MARKHRAKIATPYGLRQCFEARVERDGKPALVARFGGIPLIRNKDAVLTDRVRVQVPYPRKELVIRLRARRCELCGDVGPVLAAPGPAPRQPRPTRTGPARLGGTHGHQAAQNPRGLPLLP